MPEFLPVTFCYHNTDIAAYGAPTRVITVLYNLIVYLSKYANRYFQGLYTLVISFHMH